MVCVYVLINTTVIHSMLM